VCPSPQFVAEPLEENLFEWHFTLRGGASTAFEGGVYHGRIVLPPEYPFKPPNISLLTPNGRFETGKKICLSISAHHPESWQPAWGVRTILTALIAFFPTKADGALAGLDYSDAERRALATRSLAWRCPKCESTMADALPPARAPEAGDGVAAMARRSELQARAAEAAKQLKLVPEAAAAPSGSGHVLSAAGSPTAEHPADAQCACGAAADSLGACGAAAAASDGGARLAAGSGAGDVPAADQAAAAAAATLGAASSGSSSGTLAEGPDSSASGTAAPASSEALQGGSAPLVQPTQSQVQRGTTPALPGATPAQAAWPPMAARTPETGQAAALATGRAGASARPVPLRGDGAPSPAGISGGDSSAAAAPRAAGEEPASGVAWLDWMGWLQAGLVVAIAVLVARKLGLFAGCEEETSWTESCGLDGGGGGGH